MIAISEKGCIFAFDRSMLGVNNGPDFTGLFLFSPLQYSGGSFPSRQRETLSKDLSAEVATALIFAALTKTCSR